MFPRSFFPAVVLLLALNSISVEGDTFRIVNGRNATTLEFPYQVSLEVKGYQWCGGSIYNEHFVITASHCVKWAENRSQISPDMMVRVGSDTTLYGGSLHNVSRVYVHENYVANAEIDKFDIALVKVVEPFVFTDRVQPIKVINETAKDGDMCWVTGYGRQGLMRSHKPEAKPLMAVELPVIGLRECQELLYGVADDMICAGFKKGHRDACSGDSGGPLAVNGELAGIVAWGIGCGREGVPGVYTNTALYRQWILDKIAADTPKNKS